MRLSELATCGRQPSLPLTVDVGEAGDLVVEQWLRVLPGQRYVGRARWQGRTVLAKLMVGGNGHRHYLRERDGAALLIAQDLATPGVLAEGWRAGEGGWLLFEFLDDARSLWDAWRECEHAAPLTEGQAELLGAALELIAQMHSRGLWQEDLHLDNLLLQTGVLHVVDGGGVRAETPGQPLSRERVLANLGVFFAQLPTTVEPFIEESPDRPASEDVRYVRVRPSYRNGWHVSGVDAEVVPAVDREPGAVLPEFLI